MAKLCSQLSGVNLDGELVEISCQEHRCHHYIWVEFEDQHGETHREFGCALNYIVFSNLQTAKFTNQVSADVQDFRNRTVRQNERLIEYVEGQARLAYSSPEVING